MKLHYSVVIQWSDEDQKYILSLPEFDPYARTHGATYEEALQNGREVLQLLIKDYQARGKDLPQPLTLQVASDFVKASYIMSV
ncbi:MAG: type II toxin-antitoxin system HicB family antitoxin [Oscillatoria sp. SIO1A7]|nr:type II toxin-antitoxin system HicB family antitoxin [Oscillatoria sp. SIO1A7]